jgi:hypothetical protein
MLHFEEGFKNKVTGRSLHAYVYFKYEFIRL